MVNHCETNSNGDFFAKEQQSQRFIPFAVEEANKIQTLLDLPIEADQIQFRPSAQGSVAYVEGWKALALANEAFGFNGWSSTILQLTTDFVEVTPEGRVSLGIMCIVRVQLRDGAFHDDIGYGTAENQRGRGAAFEKARKEAVTDAMKRALRMFGNRLGNCAYDKAFLRQVKSGSLPSAPPPKINNFNGNRQNLGANTSTTTHTISHSKPPSTTTGPNQPIKTTTLVQSHKPIESPSESTIPVSGIDPPTGFTPRWHHPKELIHPPPPPSNLNQTITAAPPTCEPSEHLVLTEEQLLEFGSSFNESFDSPQFKQMNLNILKMEDLSSPHRSRPKLYHQAGSNRSDLRSSNTAGFPTVPLPQNHVTRPHPK